MLHDHDTKLSQFSAYQYCLVAWDGCKDVQIYQYGDESTSVGSHDICREFAGLKCAGLTFKFPD